MVIDRCDEDELIKALSHLREAKSILDWMRRGIGERGDVGERERLIQETLQTMARRISIAHRDGLKLIPRRRDFRIDDKPFRPKRGRSDGPPRPPSSPPEPEERS